MRKGEDRKVGYLQTKKSSTREELIDSNIGRAMGNAMCVPMQASCRMKNWRIREDRHSGLQGLPHPLVIKRVTTVCFGVSISGNFVE